MTRTARSLTLLSLALAAASAHAGSDSLGLDSTLGLLTFNQLVASGSSITGGVAVGGNATLSNYAINAASSSNGLVVGGNLSFSSGTVNGDTRVGGNLTSSYSGSFNGNVAVGGALSAASGLAVTSGHSTTVWGATSGMQTWYPTVTRGSGTFSTGYDFTTAETRLTTLSAQLDAAANTGTVQNLYATLHFDVTGLTVAVFDISAAQAAMNMQIDGLSAGTSVIINVAGTSVDFGSHGYTNFGSGQVLFNLDDATSVSFSGGVTASFLAPEATFTGSSGQINGQVVADNWLSGVSINAVAFNGALPSITTAVPEPQTWALLLAGLIAVISISRRRRR